MGYKMYKKKLTRKTFILESLGFSWIVLCWLIILVIGTI